MYIILYIPSYAIKLSTEDFGFVDEKTGEMIEEVPIMGGWRTPYFYDYEADAKAFHYSAEYEYHPEDIKFIIQESQNRALSVVEIYESGAPDGLITKDEYKYAIYVNGRFASGFIYDHVIGGNSIAIVGQNDKYALTDINGDLLTGFDFDEVAAIVEGYIAADREFSA